MAVVQTAKVNELDIEINKLTTKKTAFTNKIKGDIATKLATESLKDVVNEFKLMELEDPQMMALFEAKLTELRVYLEAANSILLECDLLDKIELVSKCLDEKVKNPNLE